MAQNCNTLTVRIVSTGKWLQNHLVSESCCAICTIPLSLWCAFRTVIRSSSYVLARFHMRLRNSWNVNNSTSGLVVYMEPTAPKEKATGEKRPATALELGTYALSRSFSHASHGDRSRSSVPHRSYVPVCGSRG